MAESPELLMLEFLTWVADRRRTYDDAMAAWQSHCPRQTIWEDAIIDGLIQIEESNPVRYEVVSHTAWQSTSQRQQLDQKNHRIYRSKKRPKKHSKRTPMTSSTLLFGATSILGYSIARLFPDTVLPFVTRANRAKSIRQWPVLNLEDPAWP